jgi:hypothetical protein
VIETGCVTYWETALVPESGIDSGKLAAVLVTEAPLLKVDGANVVLEFSFGSTLPAPKTVPS